MYIIKNSHLYQDFNALQTIKSIISETATDSTESSALLLAPLHFIDHSNEFMVPSLLHFLLLNLHCAV